MHFRRHIMSYQVLWSISRLLCLDDFYEDIANSNKNVVSKRINKVCKQTQRSKSISHCYNILTIVLVAMSSIFFNPLKQIWMRTSHTTSPRRASLKAREPRLACESYLYPRCPWLVLLHLKFPLFYILSYIIQ